ncbi:P-loop NTPase fold protein [Planococcus sp. 11815]|uniref:P-loop NTPase fold protein n=1 Tax=Planococcus sp. 11815 TaxID=2939413 RepID=UPI003DA48A2F
MKIEVDIKQIKDAPINNGTSLDKRKIKILKQELLMGNPTTYLVSGYRGVGKTSFIKTLVNEIKSESELNKVSSNKATLVSEGSFIKRIVSKIKFIFLKTKKVTDKGLNDDKHKTRIFIHLNVGKYSGFSNVLRSLIREIYWGLSNSREDVKNTLKENPELFYEIELIYARTFHEIEAKESYLENEETIKSFLFSANLRNIITRISTFLLGSLSFINYIKDGNWYSYVIPVILLIGLLISFEYSKKKSKTNTKELNRKTFFDDEVAEFQLTRIVSKLSDIGIEIVFIIDELDKIEKEEDINSLISDLKPLMLLGKSNYILIFGQKMLYRYLMADVLDNNMLSSIFTRNVHIPLLNKSGFEKYFISLIGEENYSDDLVKKYLDSKILLSNRIFRKFISIIRNDIKFDEYNKTYIEIDGKDEIMLTNATISLVVYQVEEEIIEVTKDNIEEGVIDFLISNLYIAIKNMKRLRPISFEIDDILKNKNFIDDEFASAYLNYIRENIQSLIDKMLEQQLLEVDEVGVLKSNETEEEIKTRYKWSENAVLGKINNNNAYDYLDEFIRFEKWLRDLFYQSQKYILNKPYGKVNSALQIFNALKKERIISKGVGEEFYSLSKVRNQIVHGEELSDFEKESLISFSEDLSRVKAIIFEEVMISTVKAFNTNSYRQIDTSDLIYDVDMIVNNVAFEFKTFKYETSIKKYLKGLNMKTKEYTNDFEELRVIILLDGEIEKDNILSEINSLENSLIVKVKLIEEIEIFKLQDFLRVKIIN